MSGRRVHAIRGATTVDRDDPESIRSATGDLLAAIAAENRLDPAEIVSVFFTVTPDLTSEFPARAARDLGWTDVALLCMSEIGVAGSLPRCIRVLLHVELARPGPPLRPVYLREATRLRPDWASPAGQSSLAERRG